MKTIGPSENKQSSQNLVESATSTDKISCKDQTCQTVEYSDLSDSSNTLDFKNKELSAGIELKDKIIDELKQSNWNLKQANEGLQIQIEDRQKQLVFYEKCVTEFQATKNECIDSIQKANDKTNQEVVNLKVSTCQIFLQKFPSTILPWITKTVCPRPTLVTQNLINKN